MSKSAPPLRVSAKALNQHSAAKHAATTHQKNVTESANNASAPHARAGGGRKKRRRGGGSVGHGQLKPHTVPTLAASSGPPASSPNAAENAKNAHIHNANMVAAAANDSLVAKPKCAKGGGSRLGQFMEHLRNMEGGKRRTRTKKYHKRYPTKSRKRHRQRKQSKYRRRKYRSRRQRRRPRRGARRSTRRRRRRRKPYRR